jgi:hypothetical protein
MFYTVNVYSQDHLTGLKAGLINSNFFLGDNQVKNSFFFMGLNYEYVPKRAMLSISTEVQYIVHSKVFMIPLSINLKPGNKIKFLASGGILPIIRLEKKYPNKTIDIGGTCRIGIEYRVNKIISIYGNFGFLFIPGREYYRSSIRKTKEKAQFFNIGVNYFVNRKDKTRPVSDK